MVVIKNSGRYSEVVVSIGLTVHWGLDIGTTNTEAVLLSILEGVSISVCTDIETSRLVRIPSQPQYRYYWGLDIHTRPRYVYKGRCLGIHIVRIKFVCKVNHKGGSR